MKPHAIEQVKARLAKAKASLDGVASSNSHSEFLAHWVDFLLAVNGVYTKLSAGCRGAPKSDCWMGLKRHEQKKDPLLSYLKQARNSDEHGIEPIAEFNPGGLGVGLRGQSVRMSSTPSGGMRFTSMDGNPLSWRVDPPHSKLVQVVDTRYGDRFDPPTEHLGISISDKSPLGIGTLALKYLESLVAEAEAL